MINANHPDRCPQTISAAASEPRTPQQTHLRALNRRMIAQRHMPQFSVELSADSTTPAPLIRLYTS